MVGRNGKIGKVATLPEALEILEKREKEGEIGYEQQLALEYAKKFTKLEPEKAAKMKKELEALGISEKIAVSITNIIPVDLMQLKQILANEKKELPPEVAEKAMAVVESYKPKG
jgi:DNA-directed RNA polymerase subunit F